MERVKEKYILLLLFFKHLSHLADALIQSDLQESQQGLVPCSRAQTDFSLSRLGDQNQPPFITGPAVLTLGYLPPDDRKNEGKSDRKQPKHAAEIYLPRLSSQGTHLTKGRETDDSLSRCFSSAPSRVKKPKAAAKCK